MTYTTAARASLNPQEPEDIDVPTLAEEEELVERILAGIDAAVERESEEDSVEDVEEVEEKGVRYVRTPEGAAHYGQPIGTPIIADSLGNPLRIGIDTNQPQAASPAMEQAAVQEVVLNWRDVNDTVMGRSAHAAFGRYSTTVEETGGKFRWNLRTTNYRGASEVIEEGRSNTFSAAKNAATRALKKRHEEYQKRTKRNYSNIFEYTEEGIEGYDYWPDGRKVTDEERTRFEEDPDYRYNLALDRLERMGIRIFNLSGQGDDLEVNTLETIANHMQAYEDMYPGFIENILDTFSSGRARNSNALAYNTIDVMRAYGADGNKGMMTEVVLNPTYFGENGSYDSVDALHSYDGPWFSVDMQNMRDKYGEEYYEHQLKMMAIINHEIGHSFGRIALGELIKPGFDMGGAKAYFHEGFYDIMWNWGFIDEDQIQSEDEFAQLVSAERGAKSHNLPILNFDSTLLSEVLSRYGATSFHELIAEAWAEYILDPSPRQFSVEVGNLLDETMRIFLESKGTV